METLQAFVLGIVQGITEFLPISSSAHLVLVPKFADWPDQGLLFDISVHVGTLAAVMIYFRKDVLTLVRGKLDVLQGRFSTPQALLFLMLVASTVPLVIFAPLMKDCVELYARSYGVIAFTSIFFGLLLWWADRRMQKCAPKNSIEKITVKEALVFGLFQALAVIPGTSRSGITMTAGRMMGFSREDSSRFSMLMAMPVIVLIAVASLFSDFESGSNISGQWGSIAIGASVSFVCAFLAIHLLMKFVERVGFLPFVLYRLGLGGLLVVLAVLH